MNTENAVMPSLSAVKSSAAVGLAAAEAAINRAIESGDAAWFSSPEGKAAYDYARICAATIKAETFKVANLTPGEVVALPIVKRVIVGARREKAVKATKGFNARLHRVGLI